MKIALPNKGRLYEPTIDILRSAGIDPGTNNGRKLLDEREDVSFLYVRAADIPRYVDDGAADIGITGLDQVREARADDVVELLDLGFGRCRLVLAAPEDDPIESVRDVEGKTVATEFPNVTRDYFDQAGVAAELVEVSGATELTPHADIADAIVDITSTGRTLAANHLTEVDEVLSSSARLFARESAVDDDSVHQVVWALKSVVEADGKRYLMMNVPEERIDRVRELISGRGGPTVMDVAGSDNVAVHVIVDRDHISNIIPKLRELGAADILITQVERFIR